MDPIGAPLASSWTRKSWQRASSNRWLTKLKLPEDQQARNEALARKFEIQAFPTVLIIDGEGKVLDKMVGYPRGGLDGFLKFITEQTNSGS
jgi:thioredoxin-related protein